MSTLFQNKQSFIETNESKKRFIELDVCKGLAVIGMVIFHFFYVGYLYGANYNISGGWLYPLAKFAHTTFITIVGINIVLSFTKWFHKVQKKWIYYRRQLLRSVKLMVAALIVTLYTKQEFPDRYVRFGIFHFISVVSVGALLINWSQVAIMITLIATLLLQYYKDQYSHHVQCWTHPNLCSILGIKQMYGAIDHFSILKKLPYVLIGMLLGKNFYKKNDYRFAWQESLRKFLEKHKITRILAEIGKWSLPIYFIHFAVFIIWYKCI